MKDQTQALRQRNRLSLDHISSSTFILALVFAAASIASPAQTFTKLADFGATNTDAPSSPLVQGLDGNFYGTTYQGTGGNFGSVYKVSSQGVLNIVYGFPDGTDGAEAVGVILANDGNFYGTTQFGGTNDLGTLFKVTPAGTERILYNFSGPDGAHPFAGLVQGSDGNFYGTTTEGGTSFNLGTVFKITPDGTLTTLHRFHHKDGKAPNAALVEGNDGNFYGTTTLGGAQNFGTIFRISPGGRPTLLHSFDGNDGKYPDASLVKTPDGTFYGTASEGANLNSSRCPSGCGTIYKITPTGVFTPLYAFCPASNTSCSDGVSPVGIVQTTDGNFYGLASAGGSSNLGVIFKFTPTGSVTTLYTFCTKAFCPDGSSPGEALLQGTDGNLYGVAGGGGDFTHPGTIFQFSTGLAPFVRTVQGAGKVDSSVTILGSDLTGASAVSFNGKEASFSGISATEITATVPAGATTGRIQVVTPGGTLLSNVPFRVIP